MGIVIIDYGMGNLRSVQKKIESLKVDVETTADLTKIANAQKLVLPGVGNFANGVKKLKERIKILGSMILFWIHILNYTK